MCVRDRICHLTRPCGHVARVHSVQVLISSLAHTWALYTCMCTAHKYASTVHREAQCPDHGVAGPMNRGQGVTLNPNRHPAALLQLHGAWLRRAPLGALPLLCGPLPNAVQLRLRPPPLSVPCQGCMSGSFSARHRLSSRRAGSKARGSGINLEGLGFTVP